MPERPEIEDFGNCAFCGALVDMRDLAQVMAHMHGQVPLDLTGQPDPESQIGAKPSLHSIAAGHKVFTEQFFDSIVFKSGDQ
jgi:hypothetical protein